MYCLRAPKLLFVTPRSRLRLNYTAESIDWDTRALDEGNIRAEGSNEPIDGNHGLTEMYRELLAGA